MDHSQSTCTHSEAAQHTPQSSTSTSTTSSPAISLFSRGHVSRGSGSTSSIASSPKLRDSFDLFGNSKRLEDVREDPSEREEVDYDFVNDTRYSHGAGEGPGPIHINDDQSTYYSTDAIHYTLGDQDSWSTSSSDWSNIKRSKSANYSRQSMTNRIASRFPSLSRKLKHKSGAGLVLSLDTDFGYKSSRNDSGTSSQLISPALSAISKHESFLPPPSMRPSLEASLTELPTEPMAIEQDEPQIEEPVQATTPLLPPLFTQMARTESPIQSPLQSPSVAAAPTFESTTPEGSPLLPPTLFPGFPIPGHLSAKPSVASFRGRSRANTANVSIPEIPPLPMLDEGQDPWAQRLGHANFDIHPEPYTPEVISQETYREFRNNWDLARRNYTKHLARTGEHYGTTSKVYGLTQEKWEALDMTWKRDYEKMFAIVGPSVSVSAAQSSEAMESADSSTILEKPVTRIVVPKMDDSRGKFPELGDEDIVGPMTVVPARSPTMQQSTVRELSPQSPSRRHLFKFLSELFSGKGART